MESQEPQPTTWFSSSSGATSESGNFGQLTEEDWGDTVNLHPSVAYLSSLAVGEASIPPVIAGEGSLRCRDSILARSSQAADIRIMESHRQGDFVKAPTENHRFPDLAKEEPLHGMSSEEIHQVWAEIGAHGTGSFPSYHPPNGGSYIQYEQPFDRYNISEVSREGTAPTGLQQRLPESMAHDQMQQANTNPYVQQTTPNTDSPIFQPPGSPLLVQPYSHAQIDGSSFGQCFNGQFGELGQQQLGERPEPRDTTSILQQDTDLRPSNPTAQSNIHQVFSVGEIPQGHSQLFSFQNSLEYPHTDVQEMDLHTQMVPFHPQKVQADEICKPFPGAKITLPEKTHFDESLDAQYQIQKGKLNGSLEGSKSPRKWQVKEETEGISVESTKAPAKPQLQHKSPLPQSGPNISTPALQATPSDAQHQVDKLSYDEHKQASSSMKLGASPICLVTRKRPQKDIQCGGHSSSQETQETFEKPLKKARRQKGLTSPIVKPSLSPGSQNGSVKPSEHTWEASLEGRAMQVSSSTTIEQEKGKGATYINRNIPVSQTFQAALGSQPGPPQEWAGQQQIQQQIIQQQIKQQQEIVEQQEVPQQQQQSWPWVPSSAHASAQSTTKATGPYQQPELDGVKFNTVLIPTEPSHSQVAPYTSQPISHPYLFFSNMPTHKIQEIDSHLMAEIRKTAVGGNGPYTAPVSRRVIPDPNLPQELFREQQRVEQEDFALWQHRHYLQFRMHQLWDEKQNQQYQQCQQSQQSQQSQQDQQQDQQNQQQQKKQPKKRTREQQLHKSQQQQPQHQDGESHEQQQRTEQQQRNEEWERQQQKYRHGLQQQLQQQQQQIKYQRQLEQQRQQLLQYHKDYHHKYKQNQQQLQQSANPSDISSHGPSTSSGSTGANTPQSVVNQTSHPDMTAPEEGDQT